MKPAVLSPCRRYRYLLTRVIGPGFRTVTFILLNPSTANARWNDNTIGKCIRLALKWGCGRIRIINIFAVRTKHPEIMKRRRDPIGRENSRHFNYAIRLAKRAKHKGIVVCGWGNDGMHLGQHEATLQRLAKHDIHLFALEVNANGTPRHPLYVAESSPLIPYRSAN